MIDTAIELDEELMLGQTIHLIHYIDFFDMSTHHQACDGEPFDGVLGEGETMKCDKCLEADAKGKCFCGEDLGPLSDLGGYVD